MCEAGANRAICSCSQQEAAAHSSVLLICLSLSAASSPSQQREYWAAPLLWEKDFVCMLSDCLLGPSENVWVISSESHINVKKKWNENLIRRPPEVRACSLCVSARPLFVALCGWCRYGKSEYVLNDSGTPDTLELNLLLQKCAFTPVRYLFQFLLKCHLFIFCLLHSCRGPSFPLLTCFCTAHTVHESHLYILLPLYSSIHLFCTPYLLRFPRASTMEWARCSICSGSVSDLNHSFANFRLSSSATNKYSLQ